MEKESFFITIRPVLALLAAMWVIEVVNQLLGHRLNAIFGLEPRRLGGLIGVPAMPFLHGSFAHLIANTIPLGVLGTIGVLVAPRRFLMGSIIIVFVTGLAVWFLARGGIVVGASGLIFGWFGFLVTLGAIERSPRAVAGAVVVIVLYGGMIWGVVPQERAISWEAHFLGAVAGGWTAWIFRLKAVRG